MQNYEYKALLHGEIRLLRLDALTHSGQPLTGSIIHHVLTNPQYIHPADGEGYLEYSTRYEAVSYHWGSVTNTPFQLIIHDDSGEETVIRLTSTLHAILRKLALPDESRIIWADAICINQINSSSNVEKGQQIQLMPDIYRIAACVHVFLGEESDNVPAALEFLSSIADYSEHLDDFQHAQGEIGTALAVQDGFVLPPAHDKRWPALRAFFRRPWFRRVWIIQEFVYATEVRVICGDVEIDWHRLWLASKAYVSNRDLIYQGYGTGLFPSRRFDEYREAHEGARALHLVTDLRMRAWGYMSNVYKVFNLDRGEPSDIAALSIRKDLNAMKTFEEFSRSKLLSDRASGNTFPFGRLPLLDLLHRTSNFQSTQPIDRLYGLLGLAEDASGYKPIYSTDQTVSVVSTQFATAFINNGHLGIILATAGIRSNDFSPQDPPSWVPDWTKSQYAQDANIGFTRLAIITNTPNEHDDVDRGESLSKIPRPKMSAVRETKSGSVSTSGIVEETETNLCTDTLPDNPNSTKDQTRVEKKLYNAAGNTRMSFGVDTEQGVLTVRATAVSRIVLVVQGKLLLSLQLYDSLMARLGTVYPTGEPMVEAFWRTLIANRTIHGEVAPPEFAVQYQNMRAHDSVLFFKACFILLFGFLLALPAAVVAIRYLPILAHIMAILYLAWKRYVLVKPATAYIVLLPVFRWIYVWLLVPILVVLVYYLTSRVYAVATLKLWAQMGISTAATTTSLPEDCGGYASSLGLTANRHSLCFTADRLIGLMPLLTQEGDIVVIVHGCDVPFVIRPTQREGFYRLVGEAYVHGVMHGEMMFDDNNAVDIALV